MLAADHAIADLRHVKERIENPEQKVAILVALLESRDKEILALKQQIDWLKGKLFGRSRDTFDHPELFPPEETKKPGASPENTSGPEVEAKANPKSGKPRPLRKQKVPENLPWYLVFPRKSGEQERRGIGV